MSEKKYFSVAKLKIGDYPFAFADFSMIPEEENTLYKGDDGNFHARRIKTKVIGDKFLSVYFEEGEAFPRPPVVYNIERRGDEMNPRNENQIERNAQTFVLIDEENQRIFISDFRKKTMLQKWLNVKINKPVIIKSIIDKENFINKIDQLNFIRLAASHDLFSDVGIFGDILNRDTHNYGIPVGHISVQINFEPNNFPEKAKQGIQRLFSLQERSPLRKLEISGRSDEKFERIFNADGIVDKVDIEVYRRDDGLFDETKVFDALVRKL